ncbi:hypothetical protein Pan216_37150 [Planctomycetes bacterium Pan216]|uniref:Uncharacterized protein n=1 Tax=Kolteria novifilia TaxID=2527975 RepID=A0A518B7B0_9BACT|nr:hypothetical protein Pan216_37150 [Planctomycetes bacterium Pan216]
MQPAATPRPTGRRFRQEVLRVGEYRQPSFGGPLKIDQAYLQSIVDSFQRAKRNGNMVPLTKDHDLSIGSRVGHIVDLELVGTKLFAVYEATDLVAAGKVASRTWPEVSVGIKGEWMDGSGQRYRPYLSHVAFVNHPVMSRQQAAVALSADRQGADCWHLSTIGTKPKPVSPPPAKRSFTMATVNASEVVQLFNLLCSKSPEFEHLSIEASSDSEVAVLVRDRLRKLQGPSMGGEQTEDSPAVINPLTEMAAGEFSTLSGQIQPMTKERSRQVREECWPQI